MNIMTSTAVLGLSGVFGLELCTHPLPDPSTRVLVPSTVPHVHIYTTLLMAVFFTGLTRRHLQLMHNNGYEVYMCYLQTHNGRP